MNYDRRFVPVVIGRRANEKRSEQADRQKRVASADQESPVCRTLVESGKCKYGERCRWSHNAQKVAKRVEFLQNAEHLPCPALVKGYECRYGKRCFYTHDEKVIFYEVENAPFLFL